MKVKVPPPLEHFDLGAKATQNWISPPGRVRVAYGGPAKITTGDDPELSRQRRRADTAEKQIEVLHGIYSAQVKMLQLQIERLTLHLTGRTYDDVNQDLDKQVQEWPIIRLSKGK